MTLSELIKAHPNATDAEIVALANAPVYSRIPIATIREIVPPITVVPSLQLMVLDPALPSQLRGLAVAIINVLAGTFTVVDRTNPVDNAGYEQMVPAALAAGIITQAQADALLALGKSVPANPVTLEQVAAARAEIALEAQRAALRTWFSSSYMNAHALIDSSNPLPTKAQLVATFNTQD